MAFSHLNSDEREVILRCLRAAVEGPFFEEWEFHTLFGLYRPEVAVVAGRWLQVTDVDEEAMLAVNSSLMNLLWYPHDRGSELQQLVGVSDAELERVFRKFKLPISA